MTTSARFLYPKDPADNAWYQVRFPEPLTALLGITATISVPADGYGLGVWTTPGDTLPATPLILQAQQLTTDRLGVTMLIGGGAPGGTYAIRVGVTTVTGATLYRSIILNVTGL